MLQTVNIFHGFLCYFSLQIHKLKDCNASKWLDSGFDPFQAHSGQFEAVIWVKEMSIYWKYFPWVSLLFFTSDTQIKSLQCIKMARFRIWPFSGALRPWPNLTRKANNFLQNVNEYWPVYKLICIKLWTIQHYPPDIPRLLSNMEESGQHNM